MEGTRLTWGIAALALLLAATALALDAAVPLFLGVSLLALLAVRALRFDLACRTVTGSLRHGGARLLVVGLQ